MTLPVKPGDPHWLLAVYAVASLTFPVLLVRLMLVRLVRSYPALTGWLAVNIIDAGISWTVAMNVGAYRWFYFAEEGFNVVFLAGMVFQVYSRVLEGLPGIASVSRRAMQVILPLSTIASLLLLSLEVTPRGPVTLIYLVSRTVVAALALFVLAITAFMVWFPIRVHRNAVVYLAGLALFFIPKAASMFLTNSLHAPYWFGGAVSMIACTLCLLLWTVGFRRAGETTCLSPVRVFHPADEARLLAQLHTINRTLTHTRRE